MPVLSALILALPGCATTERASPPLPCRQSHGLPRGARWWPCLGDAQLSALNERALATAAAPAMLPTAAQHSLSFDIASRYIALRAQQSALVLLAAREQFDSRLVVAARRRFAGGAEPLQPVAAAEAQLAATRTAQLRSRAEIAVLRERLAVLTGLSPGMLDSLPGGPIPLPPPPPPRPGGMSTQRLNDRAAAGEAAIALARYAAARAAAAQAQAQAEHARAIAALQASPSHAGAVNPGEAVTAERQALDALQAEEQARAAMTEAYVALAKRQGL